MPHPMASTVKVDPEGTARGNAAGSIGLTQPSIGFKFLQVHGRRCKSVPEPGRGNLCCCGGAVGSLWLGKTARSNWCGYEELAGPIAPVKNAAETIGKAAWSACAKVIGSSCKTGGARGCRKPPAECRQKPVPMTDLA